MSMKKKKSSGNKGPYYKSEKVGDFKLAEENHRPKRKSPLHGSGPATSV